MHGKTWWFSAALCAASLAAQAGPGGDRLFEYFDTDHDGVITQAEINSQREQRFARLDANGDGALSADELERARNRRRQIAERMRTLAKSRIMQADTDHDGQMSRVEFMNAPSPLLERADADGDGRITRAEFDTALKNLRARLEAGKAATP